MIELRDLGIYGVVGTLLLSSGLHLRAESSSLAELRQQNEMASLWAVEQGREAAADETVTFRIVDLEQLDERNGEATELRHRLTESYSTLPEHGMTFEDVMENPITPRPHRPTRQYYKINVIVPRDDNP